jgi:hypothetical protein
LRDRKGVLSLVIRSYAGPDALGLTMRAVFPGVVSGLIANAIVVAPPGDSESAAVAEAAGAMLVVEPTFVEGFAAACRRLRPEGLVLADGGVFLEEAGLEALQRRLPLSDRKVIATMPMQYGLRGALQRVLGLITRDQVLMMSRERALAVKADPWQERFGRSLEIIRHHTERPRS